MTVAADKAAIEINVKRFKRQLTELLTHSEHRDFFEALAKISHEIDLVWACHYGECEPINKLRDLAQDTLRAGYQRSQQYLESGLQHY